MLYSELVKSSNCASPDAYHTHLSNVAVWWKAPTQDSPPWYFNFVSVQLNWAQAWSLPVHKCLITFNKTALRNIFLRWKSIPVWGLWFMREGTGYVLLHLRLLCHSLLVSLLLSCRSVRGSRQRSQVEQVLSRAQRFHCNAYREGVPVEKKAPSPLLRSLLTDMIVAPLCTAPAN